LKLIEHAVPAILLCYRAVGATGESDLPGAEVPGGGSHVG
jgi:hypothetical protein